MSRLKILPITELESIHWVKYYYRERNYCKHLILLGIWNYEFQTRSQYTEWCTIFYSDVEGLWNTIILILRNQISKRSLALTVWKEAQIQSTRLSRSLTLQKKIQFINLHRKALQSWDEIIQKSKTIMLNFRSLT